MARFWTRVGPYNMDAGVDNTTDHGAQFSWEHFPGST